MAGSLAESLEKIICYALIRRVVELAGGAVACDLFHYTVFFTHLKYFCPTLLDIADISSTKAPVSRSSILGAGENNRRSLTPIRLSIALGVNLNYCPIGDTKMVLEA